jgi:hypothetical protein
MKHVSSLAITALLASCWSLASIAESDTPSYAGKNSSLMRLNNGMVLEGRDYLTADGYTSGFHFTAGFSPRHLPRLDIGARFSYRESDEVPSRIGNQPMLLDTTSLGSSLVAGIRLGHIGFFARSGFADWEGDAVTRPGPYAMDNDGIARVQGFGARLELDRLVSRLEYEEIDAESMEHLNMVTASLHYAF